MSEKVKTAPKKSSTAPKNGKTKNQPTSSGLKSRLLTLHNLKRLMFFELSSYEKKMIGNPEFTPIFKAKSKYDKYWFSEFDDVYMDELGKDLFLNASNWEGVWNSLHLLYQKLHDDNRRINYALIDFNRNWKNLLGTGQRGRISNINFLFLVFFPFLEQLLEGDDGRDDNGLIDLSTDNRKSRVDDLMLGSKHGSGSAARKTIAMAVDNEILAQLIENQKILIKYSIDINGAENGRKIIEEFLQISISFACEESCSKDKSEYEEGAALISKKSIDSICLVVQSLLNRVEQTYISEDEKINCLASALVYIELAALLRDQFNNITIKQGIASILNKDLEVNNNDLYRKTPQNKDKDIDVHNCFSENLCKIQKQIWGHDHSETDKDVIPYYDRVVEFSGSEKFFNEAMDEALEEARVIFIEGEGGMGKTQSLIDWAVDVQAKDDSNCVLYVNANELMKCNGSDYLFQYFSQNPKGIKKYLEKKSTEEWKPGYDCSVAPLRIVIDGVNEIAEENQNNLAKCLRTPGYYANRPGVQVILIGRSSKPFIVDGMVHMKLLPLTEDQVKAYIENNSIEQPTDLSEFNIGILKNPMMLHMYARLTKEDREGIGKWYRKCDCQENILWNYFMCETDNAAGSAAYKRYGYACIFAFLLVAPRISWKLVKDEKMDTDEKQLKEAINEVIAPIKEAGKYEETTESELENIPFYDLFKEAEGFDEWVDNGMKVRSLASEIIEILTRSDVILEVVSEDNESPALRNLSGGERIYAIRHQIFRDFLAACDLRNRAVTAIKKGNLGKPEDVLPSNPYIERYLSRTFENSELDMLWNKIREQALNESALSEDQGSDSRWISRVAPLINAQRYGDFTGVDFSRMDLRYVDLGMDENIKLDRRKEFYNGTKLSYFTFSGGKKRLSVDASYVVSKDRQFLLVIYGSTIDIFNINNFSYIWTFSLTSGSLIEGIDISKNNKCVVVFVVDSYMGIVLFDISKIGNACTIFKTKKLNLKEASFVDLSNITISSDGKRVISYFNPQEICLWDSSGRLISKIKAPHVLNKCFFAMDNEWILSYKDSPNLYLFSEDRTNEEENLRQITAIGEKYNELEMWLTQLSIADMDTVVCWTPHYYKHEYDTRIKTEHEKEMTPKLYIMKRSEGNRNYEIHEIKLNNDSFGLCHRAVQFINKDKIIYVDGNTIYEYNFQNKSTPIFFFDEAIKYFEVSLSASTDGKMVAIQIRDSINIYTYTDSNEYIPTSFINGCNLIIWISRNQFICRDIANHLFVCDGRTGNLSLQNVGLHPLIPKVVSDTKDTVYVVEGNRIWHWSLKRKHFIHCIESTIERIIDYDLTDRYCVVTGFDKIEIWDLENSGNIEPVFCLVIDDSLFTVNIIKMHDVYYVIAWGKLFAHIIAGNEKNGFKQVWISRAFPGWEAKCSGEKSSYLTIAMSGFNDPAFMDPNSVETFIRAKLLILEESSTIPKVAYDGPGLHIKDFASVGNRIFVIKDDGLIELYEIDERTILQQAAVPINAKSSNDNLKLLGDILEGSNSYISNTALFVSEDGKYVLAYEKISDGKSFFYTLKEAGDCYKACFIGFEFFNKVEDVNCIKQAVFFSSKGCILLAFDTGTVVMYNFENNDCNVKIRGYATSQKSVCFTNNNKHCLVLTQDDIFELWNIDTGKKDYEFSLFTNVNLIGMDFSLAEFSSVEVKEAYQMIGAKVES